MYIRYFKQPGMIDKINIGMQYAEKIELSITITSFVYDTVRHVLAWFVPL